MSSKKKSQEFRKLQNQIGQSNKNQPTKNAGKKSRKNASTTGINGDSHYWHTNNKITPPVIENVREENGVKFFSSSSNGLDCITFFVGKTYENAEKRGKAVFYRDEWKLGKIKAKKVLIEKTPVKKFLMKTDNVEMVCRIKIEPNGGQETWNAVSIETHLERQKKEKADFGALLNDYLKEKREVFFTGDRDSVFKKARQEAEKRMISALQN